MRAVHHWIDGKEAPGTSGRTADVYNPATGEQTGEVPLASARDVDAAVQATLTAAHRVEETERAARAVGELGREGGVAAREPLVPEQARQHEVGVGAALADGGEGLERGAPRGIGHRSAPRIVPVVPLLQRLSR